MANNWNQQILGEIQILSPQYLTHLLAKVNKIAKIGEMLTFSVMSSKTIRFCLGTLPVLVPEETRRAPVSVMEFGPTDLSGDHMCSGNIAYSYSSATLRYTKRYRQFKECIG